MSGANFAFRLFRVLGRRTPGVLISCQEPIEMSHHTGRFGFACLPSESRADAEESGVFAKPSLVVHLTEAKQKENKINTVLLSGACDDGLSN